MMRSSTRGSGQKRSTQNLLLSTSCPADYPIFAPGGAETVTKGRGRKAPDDGHESGSTA